MTPPDNLLAEAREMLDIILNPNTRGSAKLDAITQALKRAEDAERALRKIDAIRNSIIGCQGVNWSEHIYPLVAALNEAGYPGEEYEKARDDLGTLIEQTKAAEAQRDALTHRNELLAAALEPFAKQRTVDETLRCPEPSEFAGVSPERRIEMIGERKRAHDEAILNARAALNEANPHG